MNILVVGANGQIGKHVIASLGSSNDHHVRAMLRNEEQAAYHKDHEAEPYIADVEDDIPVLIEACRGMDAVVFTAGSGPKTGKDKTITVDMDGAIKTIEAAKQAGIKRYIMISSFDTTREAIQNASESFAPYVIAKHYADEHLRTSGLNYTIIHPGILSNEPGTGKIEAQTSVNRDNISREDVADVIVQALQMDSAINQEFQVINGETAIQDALQKL